MQRRHNARSDGETNQDKYIAMEWYGSWKCTCAMSAKKSVVLHSFAVPYDCHPTLRMCVLGRACDFSRTYVCLKYLDEQLINLFRVHPCTLGRVSCQVGVQGRGILCTRSNEMRNRGNFHPKRTKHQVWWETKRRSIHHIISKQQARTRHKISRAV